MILQFTIPDTKVQLIIDAMKSMYAIPQIPVDVNDPTKGMKNQFTDAQWPKECTMRWVVELVQKYENQRETVKVIVPKDNSIIS